jgi:hypothetical protein
VIVFPRRFSGVPPLVGRTTAPAFPEQLTVRATTVDEVVADLKLDAVDFVKADIEGAERHMLKGSSQTIARFAPRLALCIYHLPDDPVVIPQLAKTLKPYKAAMNVAHSQVFLWCESPDAT